MRVAFQEQPRLDCPPVDAVLLNPNCRDEIIPIWRALQHVYAQAPLRHELLDLIGKDVNPDSSPDRGREGLSYWTIMVLAAVRLGCNFDYDKLQDLAEQHRALRLMMGIGDWEDQTDFDWRRIRDNLCLLRPQTLEKINRACSDVRVRGADRIALSRSAPARPAPRRAAPGPPRVHPRRSQAGRGKSLLSRSNRHACSDSRACLCVRTGPASASRNGRRRSAQSRGHSPAAACPDCPIAFGSVSLILGSSGIGPR
jgi:hypothetical protein